MVGRLHGGGHGPGRGEPDLLAEVRALLGEDHPLPLLGLTSSLLAALEPELSPMGGGDDPDELTVEQLLASFVEVDGVETTALLAAAAELVDDELMTRRIRRELRRRRHPLPTWLRVLGPGQVTGVHEVTHVLGDGSDLFVGLHTASGDELTAVVHLDHHSGSIPADGFVYPGPPALGLEEVADDPDMAVVEVDPDVARARLEEAIRHGRMTWPPIETDTWPAARPLVEWLVRQLPEGAALPEPRLWSEQERDELAEQFLASPFGAAHRDDDARELLSTLLWYACDYGPDDPLVWSPLRVEILLLDWLPRKVVASASYLAGAPAVLRDLVRFGHDRRGLRPELTTQALAAVDELDPDYQQLIRSDRPQGPAALLAAMGLDVGIDGWHGDGPHDDPYLADSWDEWSDGDVATIMREYRERELEALCDAVGGAQALAQLTLEPLPDEPLDWGAVPDDVLDAVEQVVALTDRCAIELFEDAELRTACRRLVVDVARAAPKVFGGRGRVDTAAAACTWIVARVNEAFDSYGQGVSVGEMCDWFGIGSHPSQRARTMLRALGVEDDAWGVRLGTPRHLTATRRNQIVRRCDELTAALDEPVRAGRPSGGSGAASAGVLSGGADGPAARGAVRAAAPWLDVGVDPAPGMSRETHELPDVLAVAWFPREEFAAALEAFPSLGMRLRTDDPDRCAQIVQATLLDLARDHGRQPQFAPMTVASLTAFADTHGLDADTSLARAAHAADLAGRGAGVSWPPGRNDPCWCGSGRKYKKCCDTVPVDPARRERPAPDAAVYEFDVSLVGTEPPVWRRFRLDATGTFGDLHRAVQDACGWQDAHLFVFRAPDGTPVAGSAFDGGWEVPDPAADTVPLVAWFADHDRIAYEYDFGDSWLHDVVLRQRLDEPDQGQRRLVDGARAFPPEDCGGLPGYEQCMALARGDHDDLADPDDLDEFAEWLGDWDPDRFDLEAARRRFDR